ncbi:MAG: tyrosine-type recombinase/integrase [Anaerolineae bacterium]|nr:tyrosine-type recombinase/integrase [Anaerolineae bacterium]
MPTVAEAIALYIRDLEIRDTSAAHRRTEQSRLAPFVEEFGSGPIASVTRLTIIRHVKQLSANRGYTLATQASLRKSHRAFWGWVAQQGWTEENLGDRLKVRRQDWKPQMRRAAPESDLIALKAALDPFVERRAQHPQDVRDALFVSLSLDSGARLGAIAALRVTDMENALQRTVAGRYVATSPGKTGRERIVFGSHSARLYHLWMDLRPGRSPYVFVSMRSGRHLLSTSIAKAHPRLCKFAGVPPFRTQAIRKRNVTEVRRHKGLTVAQRYAGHSDPRTTMIHYDDIDDEEIIEAAAAIDRQRQQPQPDEEERNEMARLFRLPKDT